MVDINALDLARNPQARHHELPDLELVEQLLNMPENAAAPGERRNFTSPRVRFDKGHKDSAQSWTFFVQAFETQMVLTYGLSQRELKYLLVSALGEKERAFAGTELTKENLDNEEAGTEYGTVKKLLDKLTLVFRPKNFELISKKRFSQALQCETDTVAVFAGRLNALFNEAYPNAQAELKVMLTDKFISGLLNKEVRVKLLDSDEKDFDKLVRKAEGFMSTILRDRVDHPAQYSETKQQIGASGLGFSPYAAVPADLISQTGQRGPSQNTSQGYQAYMPLLDQ
jgi:hypothetical protein